MMESGQLLRQYLERHSEAAFRELVERHLNLVYSTALRRVNGDVHLAQDIAQTVFTDLARKAASLPADVVLGGWLHRHTCFVAATAIRGERRRHDRERQAAEMNAVNHNSESGWKELAPVLDEAMDRLSSEDRDALVLRFFEQRDLRRVGDALGVSEDAAQKRVFRALERLRVLLANRGVGLSAAGLGALLAGNAVVIAPPAFSATVAGAALAGAAIGTVSKIALGELICFSKLKAGLITAALVGGLTVPLLLQHESLRQSRAEVESLRRQVSELEALREENARLAAALPDAAEQARLREEHLELLRLRGMVSLQRQQSQTSAPQPVPVASRPVVSAAPPRSLVNLERFVTIPLGPSWLRLTGTSTLGAWAMESRIIVGSVALPAGAALEPAATAESSGDTNALFLQAEVSIPVRAIKGRDAKMDEVMQARLRERQYKQIHFRLLRAVLKEPPPKLGGLVMLAAEGELGIAGVTNHIDLEIGYQRLPNNQIKFTGSKQILMSEFRVEPPRIRVGDNVMQAGDEVRIEFEWLLAQGR